MGSLSFLAGNGAGGFGPEILNTNGAGVGLDNKAITSGDLDGDGKADLLTTVFNSGTYGIKAAQGNGDGTFSTLTNFNSGGFHINPVIADVNGDGIPDIIAVYDTMPSANNVSVYLGLGGGRFAAVTNFSTLQASGAAGVTIADLNGDGRPDIVMGSGNNVVYVFLNQTAPRLNIIPFGKGIQLFWPNWTYNLETRTNLLTGHDWTAVTDAPIVLGSQKVVTNLLDQPVRFYRLKTQ